MFDASENFAWDHMFAMSDAADDELIANLTTTGGVIPTRSNGQGAAGLRSLEDQSLDKKTDFSYQWFGFTNESDPYLLSQMPSDTNDELKYFKLIYRAMKDVDDFKSDRIPDESSPVPTHFLLSHRQTVANAVEIVNTCLAGEASEEKDRKDLEQEVNIDLGVALISLYAYY